MWCKIRLVMMSEHHTHTKFGQIINCLKKYQGLLHGSIVTIIIFIDFQFNPILPINDINLIIIGIASITYFSIYVNKLIIKQKQKNHPHIICPECNSKMETLGAWKCTECPGIFDPNNPSLSIQNMDRSSNDQSSKVVEMIKVLKNRLVKGEINEEEFFKLKKIIIEN